MDHIDPPKTGLSRAKLAERYDRDRLALVLSAARTYGPVVELAPGTVLVSEPAAVQDVLRRTGTAFRLPRNLRREPELALRGDASYDSWMKARRSATTTMTQDMFDTHRAWLCRQSEALCDHWASAAGGTTAGTTTVDPLPALTELCGLSWARFCFGEGAQDLAGRTREMLDALFPILASPFELPRVLHFLPRYRRLHRAHRNLRGTIRQALETSGAVGHFRCRAVRNSRCPEVGLAMELKRSGITDDQIVRLMVSTHNAGTGVPAAALVWAMYELARNPSVADDLATVTDPRDARLDRFVREVLRLWPPTWMILRDVVEDQTSGQWRLAAGTSVLISPYVVHRVADCFVDPDDFRPDRWIDLRPQPGAYIPYSAGPRWCVGGQFADFELKTVLAMIIPRLRIHLDSSNIAADSSRTLLPERRAFTFTSRS